MDHFLWVCAEGRIPDLHKYRRRRTVPLCALMLHYSSALQSIIPGKLNIRTLKTNLQIKFKWGDFICIGEGNTKWPNTNARHRMENAGLLRTNKLSCAYLMKEPLKKKTLRTIPTQLHLNQGWMRGFCMPRNESTLRWDVGSSRQRIKWIIDILHHPTQPLSLPASLPLSLSLSVKMWWAKKLKKQLWVWNYIPLWGFQPFCWICILTTCLSNWKSGVRAQSLDLWYGNYLPFMPETFRESRDPEAAAVFEEKS